MEMDKKQVKTLVLGAMSCILLYWVLNDMERVRSIGGGDKVKDGVVASHCRGNGKPPRSQKLRKNLLIRIRRAVHDSAVIEYNDPVGIIVACNTVIDLLR